VSPWERWTLGATIAPQWGLGSARGISAWGLRGVARVDYAILSQLALGVGVSGRSLWASDPAAATTQLEGTTAGALLSARYVLSIGPVAVSAGPRIEALVRPIIAELAGKEVFRVPSFVAGVTIDGSAP
jgi:hypothetical protein